MIIKQILKEKGMTQRDLADKMGVSYQSIKQTLNSPSITTSTLSRIASALDVPLWRLFVSPEEVESSKQDFTALISFNDNLYKANTIKELEELISKIKTIPNDISKQKNK